MAIRRGSQPLANIDVEPVVNTNLMLRSEHKWTGDGAWEPPPLGFYPIHKVQEADTGLSISRGELSAPEHLGNHGSAALLGHSDLRSAPGAVA